jgi:carbamoyltransferase
MAAVDEERISRSKYGLGSNLLRSQARLACFQTTQLTPADIDYAVACDLVPLTLAAPFRHCLVRIQHHLAHAYGAFFSSPFESSAVLIADNAGSPLKRGIGFYGSERCVETLTYWHAQGRRIYPLGDIAGKHVLNVTSTGDYYQVGETDNSLGHMYWTTSEELGFVYCTDYGSALAEDGKTMGLAGYGDDRYIDELGQHLSLLDEGQVRLRLTDGAFRHHLRFLLSHGPDTPSEFMARRAAVARAIQSMLERALVHCASYLRRRTGERFLALAGGVALNCVATARVAHEAGFDDIFVLPAAGDNGNALGAALYGLIELTSYRGPIDIHSQLPFLGPVHSLQAFQEAVHYAAANGAVIGSHDDIVSFAAAQLAEGKVVAWYEGRSEFGPRALGHRSILADPRPPNMKDHINKIIKRREPFRPFSPMVPIERVDAYFALPPVSASSFMLVVGDVRQEWRGRLPAVTHIDGTARVQTVDSGRYPTMYHLLLAFERYTGVPILLNTSFNRAGEPMVESPMDAVKCFLETDIDLLVMQNQLFMKHASQNVGSATQVMLSMPFRNTVG